MVQLVKAKATQCPFETIQEELKKSANKISKIVLLLVNYCKNEIQTPSIYFIDELSYFKDKIQVEFEKVQQTLKNKMKPAVLSLAEIQKGFTVQFNQLHESLLNFIDVPLQSDLAKALVIQIRLVSKIIKDLSLPEKYSDVASLTDLVHDYVERLKRIKTGIASMEKKTSLPLLRSYLRISVEAFLHFIIALRFGIAGKVLDLPFQHEISLLDVSASVAKQCKIFNTFLPKINNFVE